MTSVLSRLKSFAAALGISFKELVQDALDTFKPDHEVLAELARKVVPPVPPVIPAVGYVLVTAQENDELLSDLRVRQYVEDPCSMWNPVSTASVRDATYHTIDLEYTGSGDGRSRTGMRDRYLRVASSMKFHGVPLYVVPEGYMPR